MPLLLAVAAILGISAFYSSKVIFLIILFIIGIYYFSPSKKMTVYIVIVISFFYGIAHIHFHLQKTSLIGNEKQLLLRYTDIPTMNGSSWRVFAETLEGETLLLSYTLQSKQEKQAVQEDYEMGVVCRVNGELKEPSVNRNEHAFNYRHFLQNQGVHWQFQAVSNPLQTCQKVEKNWIERVKIIRFNGLKHIEERFPSAASGFAAALLFGESDCIEEEIYNAYKTLSLVHILAISGLHVGILSAGCFYLFIRAGMTRETTKIVLICLLPIYCILAGAAPSVVRACVMVMLFLLLSLCRVRTSSITILCGVFLFLLLFNPFYIQQVGFQLSFFITFTLLMSVKILDRLKSYHSIVQSFFVTLICQIASLPIILYYFHEFSLWGFLLNVLYIPLYTIILLPATCITFILSSLSFPFANLSLMLLNGCFRLVNDFAVIIAELPYTSLSFGKPSLLFILFLLGLICLLFYCWEKNNRKYLVICSGCLVISLFLFYHKVSWSPFGEVTFIDVGQGDSILVKRPFGRGVYLIDTGGVLTFEQDAWKERRKAFEPGEDIVVPFLKSKGIRKIDKLILTHDDQDHIGGSLAVLQALKVKEIVIPEALQQKFSETDTVKLALQKRIPIVSSKVGQGWKMGEDTFQIVHPVQFEENSNESSLVLLAVINDVRWLFTGDVGSMVEKELVARYPRLTVDVLKLGHHGSKHSSSTVFLDHLQPRIAIVSAGENNRYGHPHQEVTEALEERKIALLRTDLQGGISYKYVFGRGTFSVSIP